MRYRIGRCALGEPTWCAIETQVWKISWYVGRALTAQEDRKASTYTLRTCMDLVVWPTGALHT